MTFQEVGTGDSYRQSEKYTTQRRNHQMPIEEDSTSIVVNNKEDTCIASII